MEELQLDEIPEGSVYKTNSIAVATFFGGLLAGAYLLAQNFKTTGDKRKADLTWIITVFVFIIIILAGLVPGLDKMPGFVYPLIYSLVAGWAAKQYQAAKVDKHIETGGQVYTTGRIVVVALIGFVITVAFLVLFFLMQDALAGRL